MKRKLMKGITGISSIEQCVSQGLEVCVADQILDPVRRLQPNLKIVSKPDSNSTMLGLPNGECLAALVPNHDYLARADFQRCGEGLVGRELMGMAIATPTSPSIVNSYSYYTIALHQEIYIYIYTYTHIYICIYNIYIYIYIILYITIYYIYIYYHIYIL